MGSVHRRRGSPTSRCRCPLCRDKAEKADFSALGYYESGNIFISRVLHKAYITVDEKGTKAGAATAADIKATSDTGGLYSVTLDRPFVYAVIDDAYGLPVFIGAVTDIGK